MTWPWPKPQSHIKDESANRIARHNGLTDLVVLAGSRNSTTYGHNVLDLANPNRLSNGDFETDANGDGRPDSWTSNSRATRSNARAHGGSTYAKRHFASDNSGYTISQTATGLAAGTAYTFDGWVNIPATSDAFTFRVEVRWLYASSSTISTSVVKTYNAATSGWNQATSSLVAPAGTAQAQVRMVVSSLNATIYADDFVFRQ